MGVWIEGLEGSGRCCGSQSLMLRKLIKLFGDFQVAKKAEHLPHVWDLTVVEMVVRSAKHVLKVRL